MPLARLVEQLSTACDAVRDTPINSIPHSTPTNSVQRSLPMHVVHEGGAKLTRLQVVDYLANNHCVQDQ